MANLLLYISLFLIWGMLFYHAFLMFGGYLHSLKYKSYKALIDSENNYFPTVSILIPAHNEELVIEQTIQSMVSLNYPKDRLEVVVINDNSSDRTGEIID